MRDSGNKRLSMMAAMSLALLAAGGPAAAQAAPTLRTAGDGNNRRPTPPRRDTALQREIADWNEAVQAKKDAKRLAKLRRP
jgi:hypothetical protein